MLVRLSFDKIEGKDILVTAPRATQASHTADALSSPGQLPHSRRLLIALPAISSRQGPSMASGHPPELESIFIGAHSDAPVHDMPISIIHRPIPSVLDDSKVQDFACKLKVMSDSSSTVFNRLIVVYPPRVLYMTVPSAASSHETPDT